MREASVLQSVPYCSYTTELKELSCDAIRTWGVHPKRDWTYQDLFH